MAQSRRKDRSLGALASVPIVLTLGAVWLREQRLAAAESYVILAFAGVAWIVLLLWSNRLAAERARERDHAEAALAESRRALESKKIELDQITRESEARVRDRTAKPERTARELREFFYAANHDLQEPLRAVVSYLTLAEKACEGKLDADTEKYIAVASQGAKRMQALMTDVVAYVRACSEDISIEQHDLTAAFNLARYSLLGSIRETGAEITVGPLPDVEIDESKITLVFQNLLSNAIKFRKPGEPPQIRIEALKTLEEGSDEELAEWQVSIHDEGIGFDPKYSEKIFGAFKRLHNTSKYPGNGIGLAMCRHIIEAHGGRIWAASSPGDGATFYFTLPARAAMRSAAASV